MSSVQGLRTESLASNSPFCFLYWAQWPLRGLLRLGHVEHSPSTLAWSTQACWNSITALLRPYGPLVSVWLRPVKMVGPSGWCGSQLRCPPSHTPVRVNRGQNDNPVNTEEERWESGGRREEWDWKGVVRGFLQVLILCEWTNFRHAFYFVSNNRF